MVKVHGWVENVFRSVLFEFPVSGCEVFPGAWMTYEFDMEHVHGVTWDRSSWRMSEYLNNFSDQLSLGDDFFDFDRLRWLDFCVDDDSGAAFYGNIFTVVPPFAVCIDTCEWAYGDDFSIFEGSYEEFPWVSVQVDAGVYVVFSGGSESAWVV